MDKYCRICWNTRNWKQATGEAQNYETGESYVAENGFGHEEWLFNFSWILADEEFTGSQYYRYGFFFFFGKYYNLYKGNSFSVLLYTKGPQGRNFLVAKINNLYVPEEDELKWALDQMIANGWLNSMKRELQSLGADSSSLRNPDPQELMNVRFAPDDVTFYEPRPMVSLDHKISKSARYHPFNWDDSIEDFLSTQPEVTIPSSEIDDDPTRSEESRNRAAVESITYEPNHVRMQNAIYHELCTQYGKAKIGYEKEFVDLTIRDDQTKVYIEIKTSLTAKRCIREAVGQLLEYSNYPGNTTADELWIVGDAKPTDDDKRYLDFLRKTYSLPVKYSQWNWERKLLEPPI